MPRMVKGRWMVALMCLVAAAACGGGSATSAAKPGATSSQATQSPAGGSGKVKPGTGARMCDAVTAADLAAAGLKPDLQQPSVGPGDPNPNEGAYCTYTRAYASEGGIELDIFYPADHGVYQTVVGEGSGRGRPSGLSAVDESSLDDQGNPAEISVRRGTLVFALTIPGGSRAHDQLASLATTVLSRT
jgi:hypothetical protein